MFTTRQIAALAVFLVTAMALFAGRPEGDASVAPPAPVVSGTAHAPPAGTGSRAEEVFAARYAAFFEKGIYPGLPVTMCEAKLQECRGLDLAACREHCRQACGLE
ncbi:MAG: hypothetical protein ACOY4F_06240 [Thermodesulfobacteriota bacterium]